jgi:hypothetical protein
MTATSSHPKRGIPSLHELLPGLVGSRERPEETLRMTRRVMDLLAAGKSDAEVRRIRQRPRGG